MPHISRYFNRVFLCLTYKLAASCRNENFVLCRFETDNKTNRKRRMQLKAWSSFLSCFALLGVDSKARKPKP